MIQFAKNTPPEIKRLIRQSFFNICISCKKKIKGIPRCVSDLHFTHGEKYCKPCWAKIDVARGCTKCVCGNSFQKHWNFCSNCGIKKEKNHGVKE